MKKFSNIVYHIKLVLFIINFYFIFTMLHNILDVKIYGIIFMISYLIYSFKVVLELLSKKERYKNDIIYNFMQIGLIAYILVIAIKCIVAKIYVTRITLLYFNINYIILSVLVLFIMIYNFVGFQEVKKMKVKKAWYSCFLLYDRFFNKYLIKLRRWYLWEKN